MQSKYYIYTGGMIYYAWSNPPEVGTEATSLAKAPLVIITLYDMILNMRRHCGRTRAIKPCSTEFLKF